MDWTFKGMLQQVTSKKFKERTMHELVIVRSGKYETVCVCTFWGTLDVQQGDEVETEGYMNGREYNGKYYAGLTCKTCKQFTPSAYQTSRPAATGRGVDLIPDPVTAQREKDADNEAGELPF